MTENRFVIDSWAWIEYFGGSKAGEQIKGYIENEKNTIFTSSVTVAEVVSKFLRSRVNPHEAFSAMTSLSKIIIADAELAAFAGEVHAELKATMKDFGLADAFVLASARVQKAKILTGDPHFKSIKEAILFTK